MISRKQLDDVVNALYQSSLSAHQVGGKLVLYRKYQDIIDNLQGFVRDDVVDEFDKIIEEGMELSYGHRS